jgi:hypothetical protein
VAQGLWERLDEPVLFIASDEIEKVIGDFADTPSNSQRLGADWLKQSFI